MTKTNRETWLESAIGALDKEFFAGNGYKLPRKLQVSCGFPYASARAVGQCWPPETSADKTTQMFVSPIAANPVSVLDTLLHEMIHACVGCEVGHKGIFRRLAKEFGFAGSMTHTFAEEGGELHKRLRRIARQLGRYPHAAMKKRTKKGGGGSGWVRLISTTEKTYTLMISPRKLEEHGYPVDPWGEELVLKG